MGGLYHLSAKRDLEHLRRNPNDQETRAWLDKWYDLYFRYRRPYEGWRCSDWKKADRPAYRHTTAGRRRLRRRPARFAVLRPGVRLRLVVHQHDGGQQ